VRLLCQYACPIIYPLVRRLACYLTCKISSLRTGRMVRDSPGRTGQYQSARVRSFHSTCFCSIALNTQSSTLNLHQISYFVTGWYCLRPNRPLRLRWRLHESCIDGNRCNGTQYRSGSIHQPATGLRLSICGKPRLQGLHLLRLQLVASQQCHTNGPDDRPVCEPDSTTHVQQRGICVDLFWRWIGSRSRAIFSRSSYLLRTKLSSGSIELYRHRWSLQLARLAQ